MRAISETRDNRQVDVHLVNAEIPGLDEENFEEFYLELGCLSFDEVLQYQESVYQSLQTNNGGDGARASVSNDPNPDHEQSDEEGQGAEKEGESSGSGDDESQLASDEAYARALQLKEIENQSSAASSSGTAGTEAVNREVNSTAISAPAVRQDNVDPDNMTYEELQSLEETIGTESRGLSEEVIAYLRTRTYKTGLFSRKDKHEECVICYMAYKNNDKLIELPCHHQYHSKCITRWLKINKACPVCNKEVFG